MRPLRWTRPVSSSAFLVVVVALALCLPLYEQAGWPRTHEREGYVIRVVEYVAALRAGHLYPRWCPDFYAGYGSPFFNYYAPLVYALAAYVKLLGVGVVAALKSTVLLVSAVGALGMFGWIRSATRRSDAALLGAAFYLALPYRLNNLYARGDLAEYAALALLPVVLAGYTSLSRTVPTRHLALLGAGTAVAHAGLILSHAISGLWATELLAVVVAAHALWLARRRAWARVGVMATAFGGALALSAVYTMPALFEKTLVQLERIVEPAYRPENRWLFWDELVDPGFHALGTPALCALVVLPVLCVLRRDVARHVLPWLVAASFYLLLILPHGNALWRSGLLPFGRFIQFPWRLLGLLGICLAFATARAFAALVPRTFAPRHALALIVGALVVISGLSYARTSGFYSAAEVAVTASAVRESKVSGTDVDEYLPTLAHDERKLPGATVATVAVGSAKVNTRVTNSFRFELSVDAASAASLDLNVHWFPGWKLTTSEGPQPARLEPSPTGLMRVALPAAGHYRIGLAFGTTLVRALATALSLLAAVLLYPAMRWIARRLDLAASPPTGNHDAPGPPAAPAETLAADAAPLDQ